MFQRDPGTHRGDMYSEYYNAGRRVTPSALFLQKIYLNSESNGRKKSVAFYCIGRYIILGQGDIGKNVNTSGMYAEENKTYKILWNPRSVIREENHIYISVKDGK